ncbi:hypothetical protein [Streptomyces sp. NPDC059786]|uniref:Rv1733c family protein n=1 Tax=Streptomyces sp. NPDC059786 TaxID=3346946 RepID=UPI003657454F
MAAFRGRTVWLWRWRRNPLRRPSDVLEAWVVLAAGILCVLCGVLTGLVAAQSVETGLARERAEWHPVRASLPGDAPAAAAKAAGSDRVWAKVRWTAADGTGHLGEVRVAAGTPAGTAVTVWTDGAGRMVTRPATESQARLRSSLIGALVGLSAASVPVVCGRLVAVRLERRRMRHWDEAWRRFDPLWGRGRQTG